MRNHIFNNSIHALLPVVLGYQTIKLNTDIPIPMAPSSGFVICYYNDAPMTCYRIAAMMSMALGPWGQPLRTLPIDVRHTINLSPFPMSLPAFVLIQSSPSLIPTVGRVGGKDNYFSFIYLYVLNLIHSPKALNIWRPRPKKSSNILFCFDCCHGCCGHCVFVLTLLAWKR